LFSRNLGFPCTKITGESSFSGKRFDFADKVKQALGNAHVIINNAGIEGSGRPIYLTTTEEDHKIMNINYFGVVYGTKAFLPQIVGNNEGAVVNISSIFGLIGTPNNGVIIVQVNLQ